MQLCQQVFCTLDRSFLSLWICYIFGVPPKNQELELRSKVSVDLIYLLKQDSSRNHDKTSAKALFISRKNSSGGIIE